LYAKKQIRKYIKKLKCYENKKNWLKANTSNVCLPTVEVSLGNKLNCNALIDTGASINLLSKDMLNKLIHNGVVKKVYSTKIECFSAGNHALDIKGKCQVKINIAGFCWNVEMYVANNLSWNVLLGVQFVKSTKLMLDFDKNILYFKFKPNVTASIKMLPCDTINTVQGGEYIGIPEARPKIKELMDKYSNVFTEKIGKAKGIQYDVKLKDNVIINLRPYPISPPMMLKTKKIIDELIAQDIIEPSISEFSSPSFIVSNNGKDRLVVNYSKINQHLEKVAYPIGDMSHCIHFMSGAKIFSTVDLSNSFYQVELTPESRKYTAFSTGYSMYSWKRIPYGLAVGSGVLSSVMEKVLDGLKYSQCINFIDDIICYSDTLEEHLQLLDTIFHRLSEHGLTVNPKKVKLAFSEISFLGNIIGHNTVRIDPTRVEKVLNYPRPTNVKQLATFIGMASYYSHSIPNYAETAACLNDLRKKRTKFKWTDECEESFSKLKFALSNPPTLKLADFKKEFIVMCDSSQRACAAVLMQEDENGNRQPISYFSKKFTPAEYVLTIYEKECLSLIYGIERFHKFLEVRPFILETDNMALAWLIKRGEKFGKLARWLHRILALPFKIVHVKGKSNPVADALSRCYSEGEMELPKIEIVEINHCENTSGDVSVLTHNDKTLQLTNKVCERKYVNLINDCPLAFVELKELQRQDPEIVRIIQSVVDKNCKDNFYLKNDVLMFKKNDKSVGKVYVPESLVKVLFEFYHCSSYGGHYGEYKSIQKICSKYYRPGLSSKIRSLVKSCEKCKLGKPTNVRYQGPLMSKPAKSVWHTVYTDCLGPLTRSSGYNYALLLLDDVSKYCHVIPMRNCTAQTVICKIQDVFKVHGICVRIISDNGPNFKSNEFKNFVFKLGVEHHRIPPYMYALNKSERYFVSIRNQLKIYFSEKQNGWSKDIHYLQMSINTSVNESTKFSPHDLMFSYTCNDCLTNKWNVNELLDISGNNKLAIQERIDSAIQNIKDSIKHNQKRALYSDKYSKHPYKLGDIVYLESHVLSDKSKNFQAKLANRYVGKYRIVLFENVVSCIIQKVDDMLECKRVHVSQLKR